MRGRTAKQYRNYGELLYREALSKRQNQQKLIAKKLKDDEAKVLAEMTGVPEIRYIIHSVKFLPHLWIKTCELQVLHGSIILWLLLVQHGINECDLMKFHWIWSCTWLQCKVNEQSRLGGRKGRFGIDSKVKASSRRISCRVALRYVIYLELWEKHQWSTCFYENITLHRDIAFYKCECGSCYAVEHAIFCKSTSAWSRQFEHKKEDQTKEFQSLGLCSWYGRPNWSALSNLKQISED